MEQYKNLSGNSGVAAYEIAEDFIKVKFTTGAIYLYTDQSVGSNNLSQLKALAIAGIGLNTFINTNVKNRYARKLQ